MAVPSMPSLSRVTEVGLLVGVALVERLHLVGRVADGDGFGAGDHDAVLVVGDGGEFAVSAAVRLRVETTSPLVVVTVVQPLAPS